MVVPDVFGLLRSFHGFLAVGLFINFQDVLLVINVLISQTEFTRFDNSSLLRIIW